MDKNIKIKLSDLYLASPTLATLDFAAAKGMDLASAGELIAKTHGRNYLQEAKDIIAGKTMILPEKAHLEALNKVIRDLIKGLDDIWVDEYCKDDFLKEIIKKED